jgi:hypothetical protein
LRRANPHVSGGQIRHGSRREQIPDAHHRLQQSASLSHPAFRRAHCAPFASTLAAVVVVVPVSDPAQATGIARMNALAKTNRRIMVSS